ncbi:lysophospholipid acyltransferase family protein [Chondromyces crocatus]|nr:lysophospholipid acyltransferase family protein [Chondromyces crocatus]
MPPLRERLRSALQSDSALWRRALLAGVHHGPEFWVRYSPPLFGLLFGAALPAKRKLVESNLRWIRGSRSPVVDLREISEVFASYASCLTEGLLLASERGFILKSRAQGVENYHAAAAAGRGVILATAHTGGWDLAGQIMRDVHQGGVVVVMQRERDAQARALQDEARARAGIQVVHAGESALDALPLLAHLRRGAAVALQIDRTPPGARSRQVSLFGTPWRCPEGPLTLAALSGAPILPVFTRRLGFLHYEAVASTPIWLPRRPSEAERAAAASAMVGAMERFVRESPTQWFHFVERDEGRDTMT